jgi:hypothetical protein
MSKKIRDNHFAEMKSVARGIGVEHGRNAAEWFIQDAFGGRHTGDSKAAAARVLKMIQDGDPAIWDSANVPDLSGEWADSYTEERLLRSCAFATHSREGLEKELEPEEADELCREYQDGAAWGWSSAVESSARICSAA